MNTIQISHGCQETVATIGTVISPIFQLSAFGNIVDCLHGCSCKSIEDGEVFIACQNTSLIAQRISLAWFTAGIFFSEVAAGGLCRVPWFTIIGRGISDDISLAINSAVGSFHDDFGTSVPIEVINHELGVVCTCTDIASHINAPESFAG